MVSVPSSHSLGEVGEVGEECVREYDEYERKGVCMKEGEWVGVVV